MLRSAYFAVAVAVAIALGAGTRAARAQDALLLRAETGITYESNVLRLADDIDAATREELLRGRSKGAFVTSLGAGVRADVPVSRQRYRLDLFAARNQYLDYDELDYTGYQARGAWDWRVGNDWHGELAGGTRQERRAYSSTVGAVEPRLQRLHDARLDARHALTPRWELQGGAGVLQIDNRDEEFRAEDFEQRDASLGALYRTPRGNSIGARLRAESGEWPNRSARSVALFGNDYTQYTVAALIDWQVAPRTRFFGEAGYTARERGAELSRDFDGPTGRLTLEHALTARVGLRGSVFQTRGPADNFTATYIEATGLELGATYRASAKISLEASAAFRELDYLGDALVPDVTQRRDRLTTLGLAATFRATRTLTFFAGLQYDERSSNVPLGDYHIYTAFLRAGIEI